MSAPPPSGSPPPEGAVLHRGDAACVQSAKGGVLLRLRPFLWGIGVKAGAGMVTSAGLWGGPAAAILLAASTTLGLIAAAAGVAVGLDQRRRKALVDALALAAVYDPDAILLT